ncbi:MAG: hypothetical protein UW63_C0025G0013, partial [Candidatus Uhrbacteria bacterium GW2011_GWF2_44_350]
MDTPSKKSLFEALDPKQSFILGCVAAVLFVGTIGCLGLGTYVWKNGVSAADSETANAVAAPAVVSNTAAAPATGTTALTSAISGTLVAV